MNQSVPQTTFKDGMVKITLFLSGYCDKGLVNSFADVVAPV